MSWASAALIVVFSSIALADMPLNFTSGSVRMPPPGSMMAAGYVSIQNDSDKDRRIVSATSDAFKKVELHLTRMQGDVATMRKQEFLDIKAGQSLELKQGAYHLMLMGITTPLEKGQTISITFETQDGEEHKADLLVE